MNYDALMVEYSFYGVWDEPMSCNSFFWKGTGSCNSHEMRLSIQTGMGLPKSPSLWTMLPT